jgi:predicted  nucleic acid-binding Zn-ribbon protein
MAEMLETLKHLQAVDGELFRLRKAQQDKPRELERAQAAVAAQEAALKAAEERLKVLQVAQKEQEVELQTREANVKKLQGQLFQVKTNKEYTVMQREIESLKTDNSLLEEAILKAFDAIDQAKQARQQAKGRLEEQQQRLRAEQARVERELAALHEQLTALEQQRQTLLPALTPQVLATYERVLEVRDGLALVPLVNDTCGGCHRRLPPQVINEVYLKAKLVTCESCNRILYFDEAHSKL